MEFFDIVDEKGIPTGESIERTQAHKKGIRHRTAHIWIIREQDGKAQLLLQKRSAEKDSFPGRFDTSSAGHIQAGDEPEESAIRELYEELGIQASKEELQFAGCFDIQYEKWRVWSGSIWRNWMPHCSRLEISDSAFPWRDSKSRNNGWRAENKG